MKKLQKSVTDYNVTYGTQFQVMNPSFSLASIVGEETLPSLNPYPKTGGVFLFYDRNKDLLAVYSSEFSDKKYLNIESLGLWLGWTAPLRSLRLGLGGV